MKFVLAIVALAFALLVAGCGVMVYTARVTSDEFVAALEQMETSEQARARPGRATADGAWLARVNAACARRNVGIRAVARPRGGLADLHRYATRVLAVHRAHQRRIEALAAPPSARHDAAVIRDAAREQQDALRGVIAATKARDGARAERAVTRYESVARLTGAALRSVGLTDCAELG